MGTWTKMKVGKMIEFSLNQLKTHVTISTIYGSYTESIITIKKKLEDNHMLPEVRRMFQEMDDYYEKEKDS